MVLPYSEKPAAVRRRAGQDIGHNARIKTYPDGSQDVLVCDAPIFGFQGWEPEKPRRRTPGEGDGAGDGPARAVRRAKAQVRDIALCTEFKYFVTLTLDRCRISRHDVPEIIRHLNHWLDNNVRRKGLAYVLVPERHKDGAIHFHGFFNGALEATDSGTIIPPEGGRPRRPRNGAQGAQWLAEGGHRVYNLPGWGWGFSTAIELYGTYSKAVGYVCKYIGKDQGEKIGGRWYYSGGAIGRPQVDYGDLPLEDLAAEEGAFRFSIQEAGLGFAMKHYEGGELYGMGGSNEEACGGVAVYGDLPQRTLLSAGGPDRVPDLPGEAGGRGRGGGPR